MNERSHQENRVFQGKKGRFFIFLCASFLCFLVQACSATPPPRLYELGMTAPPEKAKDASLPVLYVMDPFLPRYLDRPQIVTRKGERELFMDDKHRWAAPLGELIGERLSAGLNERLPSVRVLSGERALLHPVPMMRLEVQILDFISDDEGRTLLSGVYLLWNKNDKGREIPFTIRAEFEGKNMEARIASLGKAVDLLCLQIGDTLAASGVGNPGY